jgi:hypothetical protein
MENFVTAAAPSAAMPARNTLRRVQSAVSIFASSGQETNENQPHSTSVGFAAL